MEVTYERGMVSVSLGCSHDDVGGYIAWLHITITQFSSANPYSDINPTNSTNSYSDIYPPNNTN
jgi:hypothetical protein